MYTFKTTYIQKTTNIPKKLSIAIQHALHEGVNSTTRYNSAMKQLATMIQNAKIPNSTSGFFKKELREIQNKKPLSEKTPWGGVNLKKVDVEKNFIKKLLIIKQFGVLGFEFHKEKLEKLKVLEGICLVFLKKRTTKSRKITVFWAKPNDRFILHPGDNHGILSLTNTIIEEKSSNHLDDLQYIFKASQIS